MRDMIAYMNARKAAKAASGGAQQNHSVKYCPDRDLDLWERTDLAIDSAWSDYRINAGAMWDQIYARCGFDRDDDQSTEIPF